MMTGGQPVAKYQVAASVVDGVVSWDFGVETDDGKKHVFRVRDGEEVPVLHELCRSDMTVYFDAETTTLRSGWNVPGRREG